MINAQAHVTRASSVVAWDDAAGSGGPVNSADTEQ
jgi:hypothetical protein